MGRDHSLALYRATAAMLFAAWVVCVVGIGAREMERHAAPAQLALGHPAGDRP